MAFGRGSEGEWEVVLVGAGLAAGVCEGVCEEVGEIVGAFEAREVWWSEWRGDLRRAEWRDWRGSD